jgi:ribonucleotide reductase beta subunit family protein with ferritin-like domain
MRQQWNDLKTSLLMRDLKKLVLENLWLFFLLLLKELVFILLLLCLYSFQLRNLLKGIGQQMKWSVRDESLHSRMGCTLFKQMCEEDPNLLKTVKMILLKLLNQCSQAEEKYIDRMFELGDIENLRAYDLNNSLENVSMKNYKNLVTFTSGNTLRLTKSSSKS